MVSITELEDHEQVTKVVLSLSESLLSSADTSNVTSMSSMFFDSQSFNQNIGGWDTSNVTNMDGMFGGATVTPVFNQNLTGWCVTNITSEPTEFSLNAPLSNADKPVWGTCP